MHTPKEKKLFLGSFEHFVTVKVKSSQKGPKKKHWRKNAESICAYTNSTVYYLNISLFFSPRLLSKFFKAEETETQ